MKKLTLHNIYVRPGSTDILKAPSKIGGKHYESLWSKLEKDQEKQVFADKRKSGKICAG
jgi:hypothetical protein